MKNLKYVAFLSLFYITHSVFAANDQMDVDNFLRTVDLKQIIHTNRVVNLSAQMSDPNTNTTNVNDLNDFLAMGTKSEGDIKTWIAEFNSQLNVLDQKQYNAPWIGVDHFTQNQIPKLNLQDGLELVKSCIATKTHTPIPTQIHRIVLYKTIQTKNIVYDYVFVMPKLTPGTCQEILYIPETNDCEWGAQTLCHATVNL